MPQQNFHKYGFEMLFIDVYGEERWTATTHTSTYFKDAPVSCPHGGGYSTPLTLIKRNESWNLNSSRLETWLGLGLLWDLNYWDLRVATSLKSSSGYIELLNMIILFLDHLFCLIWRGITAPLLLVLSSDNNTLELPWQRSDNKSLLHKKYISFLNKYIVIIIIPVFD